MRPALLELSWARGELGWVSLGIRDSRHRMDHSGPDNKQLGHDHDRLEKECLSSNFFGLSSPPGMPDSPLERMGSSNECY